MTPIPGSHRGVGIGALVTHVPPWANAGTDDAIAKRSGAKAIRTALLLRFDILPLSDLHS
jgi:hypothetical protein